MTPVFTPQERKILALVQGDLPYSLNPYADLAREAGVEESDVLELLGSLRQSGAIRRFGASIRHQKAGYGHNIMVAWKASPEQADQCGPVAARHRQVSHAYYRPSPAPDWPYAFYTMIHGRSASECEKAIQELAANWSLKEYAVLPSIRELKKISMTYFDREG